MGTKHAALTFKAISPPYNYIIYGRAINVDRHYEERVKDRQDIQDIKIEYFPNPRMMVNYIFSSLEENVASIVLNLDLFIEYGVEIYDSPPPPRLVVIKGNKK